MASNKVAVIFGVTGQDGSFLAELLLNKAYRVVGVRRRTSTDNIGRVAHLMRDEHFSLVYGDVTDASSVHSVIRRYHPTEVYNLAAQSHVRVSFDEPEHTWHATACGALNILEAIRQEQVEPREIRFYQASSSEMFGSAASYFDNKYHRKEAWSPLGCPERYLPGLFQDERTELRPNSPYAIAKLAAHHATRLYREAYGLHASSGILFNHESERRGEAFVTRKISKWVAQVYKALIDNKKLPTLSLGNIDARRDWGYAQDYVYAMWLMLQQPNPDDYVVATGESHTVKEFLERALAVIGIRSAEGLYDIDPGLYRPSEVPFLKGDASKARSALLWKPEMSFDALVERMVLNDIGEEGILLVTDHERTEKLARP